MKRKIIGLLLFIGVILSSIGCTNNQEQEISEETVKLDTVDYSKYSKDELLTQSEEWPSLYQVYENYFPLGVALPNNLLQYTFEMETVLKHFNSFTCENEMKPLDLQPEEGTFTFEKAQQLVDIAVENDIRMVGHVLVWYNQTPDWFFQDDKGEFLDPELEDSKILVEQRMKDHIYTVVEYFEKQNHVIERWDVVNEAILETSPNGYREAHWLTYLGEEYVAKAFQFAHEADMLDGEKNIRLFYNDYQNYLPKKREYIYDMLKDFVDKGVPIDGVGMQCHIGLEDPTIDAIAETIDLYAGLGLDVEITEIDVTIYDKLFAAAPVLTDELNVTIGHRYLELFEMLKEKADLLTGVTLWGFYDGATWLNMAEYAVFTPAYPLPFDTLLNPKWAYWGMVEPSVVPDISKGLVDLVREDRAQNIIYTDTQPILDGELDDCYRNVEPIETMNTILAPSDGSDAATGTFRILWDENYLYAYIEVIDSVLNRGSAKPYEQDSVEIFVDENNAKTSSYEESGDAQYRVSYQNWVTFNGLDGKYEFESFAKETDTGYVVEARWKPQTVQLEENLVIGFDVQINDSGSGAFRQGIKTWSAVDNTGYKNTAVFGEITLKMKE